MINYFELCMNNFLYVATRKKLKELRKFRERRYSQSLKMDDVRGGTLTLYIHNIDGSVTTERVGVKDKINTIIKRNTSNLIYENSLLSPHNTFEFYNMTNETHLFELNQKNNGRNFVATHKDPMLLQKRYNAMFNLPKHTSTYLASEAIRIVDNIITLILSKRRPVFRSNHSPKDNEHEDDIINNFEFFCTSRSSQSLPSIW